MSDRFPDDSPADAGMVAVQIGRAPRGEWSVAARCSHGMPRVIETDPAFEQGSPFPTLYWLTCPWVKEYVDGLESAGGTDDWAQRLSGDPDLSAELLAADAEYRRRRASYVTGPDPLRGVGIAGQTDPLATKCLHAHVAGYLAGLADPIGREIYADMAFAECPDNVCAMIQTKESA